MARVGRIKFTETDAWCHLYSRIAAHKGEYPLSDPTLTVGRTHRAFSAGAVSASSMVAVSWVNRVSGHGLKHLVHGFDNKY